MSRPAYVNTYTMSTCTWVHPATTGTRTCECLCRKRCRLVPYSPAVDSVRLFLRFDLLTFFTLSLSLSVAFQPRSLASAYRSFWRNGTRMGVVTGTWLCLLDLWDENSDLRPFAKPLSHPVQVSLPPSAVDHLLLIFANFSLAND